MITFKVAEVSGTKLAPLSGPSTAKDSKPLSTFRKAGSVGHLVPGHRKQNGEYTPEEGPPYTGYTPGENMKAAPQTKVMKPHVDITGASTGEKKEKKASLYALRGHYPLDRYDHVKMASQYFDEWHKRMPPADRHEFAKNLVKRASELSIETSDTAKRYGAQTLAPIGDIKMAFDSRRALLFDEPKIAEVLNSLEDIVYAAMSEDKTASSADPEFLVLALEEFDKAAGLNHFYDSDIPDAYFSLLGTEKTATFSETLGNRTITEDQLEYLAKNRIHLVKGTFDEDLATEFKKDPVGIYKSLPVEQRKVLANLAQSQHAHDPVI